MPDDGSLPAALAADLDGTFEAVVLAFQDRLYALALRLTGSPGDAREIELRLALSADGERASEIWLYRWSA